MLQKISTLFAAAILLASCHSQKHVSHENAGSALNVYLKPAKKMTSNLARLSFKVTNPTNKPLRFCKWETPFEPRLGKYFEITDSRGNEAPFKGAMARRVMPPPAEAYITIAPHSSVKAAVNLADKYTLKPGTYTIKYTGGGVSELPEGNTVKVNLTR